METVIKLNGINKIYRTDEVETQALENGVFTGMT